MRLPAAPNRLTHAEAGGYLDHCLAALRAEPVEAGAVVALDAQALSEFDSSALAVLLAVRRRVLQLGGRWQVQGLPARLSDLAALYGVSDLLPA